MCVIDWDVKSMLRSQGEPQGAGHHVHAGGSQDARMALPLTAGCISAQAIPYIQMKRSSDERKCHSAMWGTGGQTRQEALGAGRCGGWEQLLRPPMHATGCPPVGTAALLQGRAPGQPAHWSGLWLITMQPVRQRVPGVGVPHDEVERAPNGVKDGLHVPQNKNGHDTARDPGEASRWCGNEHGLGPPVGHPDL
jgi:hypothetical protein